jgi:iron complex outermembrane receptor protein
MKSLILLLTIIFTTTFAVNAQITGVVKDAEGTPVNGATITLLKATDSSVVKLAVSKETGAYSFINLKEGNYRLAVTHVAHKPMVTAPFSFLNEELKKDLQMVKLSAALKDVSVTAKKPMVEVKADKMIVNVEGTINATGSDALELLRKSPGVQVDKDDNISLSGKNGVQVYIDGRPTPLAAADLAQFLKNLQSSQIESIELITNPSAKYEAAGNAGIINIKLKKNKTFGTNGSVNAGWNIGTYAKYNAGFALNHRNKDFNVFGNYNFNKGTNEANMSIRRTTLDTLFDQHGTMTNKNKGHNFKAGVDYFINKKSTLGVIVNGTFAEPQMANYGRTPISYIPTNTVNRILIADNRSAMKRNNTNINLNYNYNGTKGESLVLNADHGVYDINTDQYQPNMYYDASGNNKISSVIYQMLAPSTIKINSLKIDWEQNFAKGKLGYGGKFALINTDNDFQRYNVSTTGKSLDKDRSNRFRYDENINAGYVNYNRAFKGFMIQAGVRVENTNTEGKSNGLKNSGGTYVAYDSTFKRNYTDVFPSAAITFNKNPKSQFSLTYSRRIDRPFYQDLNPFEFKLDEYTFQKGNINLRPQYTNSFGLTHTYKFKLNTTLNYSHVKDLFTQLIDVVEVSKAFISKRNLATQDVVSLNISYPFQYKSYSLFANMSTNYSHYKADYGAGKIVDLNAFGFNMFAQNSLKFAKTWTAELTAFYNAPTVYQGSFKAKSMKSVDLGIQKQILKGQGTLKASVSDVFKTLKFRGEMAFGGQETKLTQNFESRQFKLNFAYRFGSNQVKAARQRKTGAEDESNRAGGGGGIGIGQ